MTRPDDRSSEPVQPRKSEKVLPLIPAGLLVVIALFQITVLRPQGVSPWKGGGFGMFSSIDRPSNRFLNLYLKLSKLGALEEPRIPIEVPGDGSYRELYKEVLTTARPATLRTLVSRLAGERWVRLGSGSRSPVIPRFTPQAAQEPVRQIYPTAVEASLWRLAWDFEARTVSKELLAIEELPATPPKSTGNHR